MKIARYWWRRGGDTTHYQFESNDVEERGVGGGGTYSYTHAGRGDERDERAGEKTDDGRKGRSKNGDC